MSGSRQEVIDAIEKKYGSDAYMLITRKQAGEELSAVTDLHVVPCDVAIGKVSADDALSMLFAAVEVMQKIYGHAFTEVALAGAVLAYSTVNGMCAAANSLLANSLLTAHKATDKKVGA